MSKVIAWLLVAGVVVVGLVFLLRRRPAAPPATTSTNVAEGTPTTRQGIGTSLCGMAVSSQKVPSGIAASLCKYSPLAKGLDLLQHDAPALKGAASSLFSNPFGGSNSGPPLTDAQKTDLHRLGFM